MADHRDHPADETRTTADPVHRDETAYTEDRRDVVGREREEHGGVKVGSAFFGWLAATGMAVLLSGIVAATGLLAGEASNTDSAGEAAAALDLDLGELGIVGIIVALAIWFVSYYSGGYVAGRMARFDGIKQGLAVWGWGLVIAIVVAVVAAVAGTEYVGIDGFPDVTADGTTAVVIAAVVVAVVALVGAMLGGLAGMRFHRQVDRTGLGR